MAGALRDERVHGRLAPPPPIALAEHAADDGALDAQLLVERKLETQKRAKKNIIFWTYGRNGVATYGKKG